MFSDDIFGESPVGVCKMVKFFDSMFLNVQYNLQSFSCQFETCSNCDLVCQYF